MSTETRETAEKIVGDIAHPIPDDCGSVFCSHWAAIATDVIDKALSDERERHQWQPIETAPTDGTAILVYGKELLREMNGNCAVVRWDCDEHSSIKWWKISDGKFGPYDLRGPSPTHWMPLPDPPAIRNDSEGD